MIDLEVLSPWESIFTRTGLKPLRRRRGSCPFCDSKTGFSASDDKGVFYCFACAAKGDKVAFIQQLCNVDFKSALGFFGLNAHQPPPVSPEKIRRDRIRQGLSRWVKTVGKELRFEFYVREKVITRAGERLRRDSDDTWGWNWLQWALTGKDRIEYLLDMIDGTEEQQLDAYRQMRKA